MTTTQTTTIEQAWNALQSTPSYVEQQVASFAATSYDERVLALTTHAPDCLEALQVSYIAQQSYITAHPAHCSHCSGSGEVPVEGGSQYPPSTDVCRQCVRRGVCPSCGASGFVPDGCEPCPSCGFEVGEDGMPERAFCTCGADRALYEGDAEVLPDFPE